MADDEDLMPIIELLEKDGDEGIKTLTANFRSKFFSMTIGNQELLERVIENEVDYFSPKKDATPTNPEPGEPIQ